MPETWTILNSLIYLIPMIIAVVVVMIYAAAMKRASGPGFRCPECGARFEDETLFKRHLTSVENYKEPKDKKAA